MIVKSSLNTLLPVFMISLSLSACNTFCGMDEALEAERDAYLSQGVEFVEDWEMEIYRSLLDELYGNRRAVVKLIVSDRSENFEALDEEIGLYGMIENELPLLESETLYAFREALKNKGIMESEVNLRYCIASDQELESAFQENGWNGFYDHFSGAGGLVSFSRVGINEAENQALAYISRRSGVRGGVDSVVLLQRQDSQRWKVIDKFDVRII